MEAPRVARNTKAHSSWNMGAILEGDRSGFARPGPKERLSRELILKAEEGNYNWIYGILRDNLASPDVADAQGYTVLAAAAVSAPLPLLCLFRVTLEWVGDVPYPLSGAAVLPVSPSVGCLGSCGKGGGHVDLRTPRSHAGRPLAEPA